MPWPGCSGPYNQTDPRPTPPSAGIHQRFPVEAAFLQGASEMSTCVKIAPAASVRTPAHARAQRAARRAAPRPVTDAAVDALIGSYDPQDAYPALTSRNLRRREERDMARREFGTEEKTAESLGGGTGCPNGVTLPGANVGDANFNRITAPSCVTASVLDDMASAEVERILTALKLPDDTARMVRLRLEGWTLQQIADDYGTNKQAIDRRMNGVGKALSLYWLSDPLFGLASVYRDEALRHVHHTLAGGRPAVDASVCRCASHQFRVQRVKGAAGQFTWHCTNCRRKYSESEYKALSQSAEKGENVVWGN